MAKIISKLLSYGVHLVPWYFYHLLLYSFLFSKGRIGFLFSFGACHGRHIHSSKERGFSRTWKVVPALLCPSAVVGEYAGIALRSFHLGPWASFCFHDLLCFLKNKQTNKLKKTPPFLQMRRERIEEKIGEGMRRQGVQVRGLRPPA